MEKIDVVFDSEWVYLHWLINVCDDPQAPFVILVPWISWKALSERFDYLAEWFNNSWLNFFRFNFTWYEEWVDFNLTNLDIELQDLKNAVNFLANSWYNMVNYGILWKSFWWLKALLNKDERMKCLGLLAPAVFVWEVWNIDVMKSVEYGIIEWVKNFVIDQKFFDDFHISTIILHWDEDDIVDLENSKKLFELLKWKKQFHKIVWADHWFHQPWNQEKIIDLTVWFFKDNL